jgi:hypothetical protein
MHVRIVIVMRNQEVVSVASNDPEAVDVVVMDHAIGGVEDSELSSVPPRGTRALVSRWPSTSIDDLDLELQARLTELFGDRSD